MACSNLVQQRANVRRRALFTRRCRQSSLTPPPPCRYIGRYAKEADAARAADEAYAERGLPRKNARLLTQDAVGAAASDHLDLLANPGVDTCEKSLRAAAHAQAGGPFLQAPEPREGGLSRDAPSDPYVVRGAARTHPLTRPRRRPLLRRSIGHDEAAVQAGPAQVGKPQASAAFVAQVDRARRGRRGSRSRAGRSSAAAPSGGGQDVAAPVSSLWSSTSEPEAARQAPPLASRFQGVYWDKSRAKWQARIRHEGKQMCVVATGS